jgi:hypothetical protein
LLISAPRYQTDRDVSLYPEEYGPGVVPYSGFAPAAIAGAVYAVRKEIKGFFIEFVHLRYAKLRHSVWF